MRNFIKCLWNFISEYGVLSKSARTKRLLKLDVVGGVNVVICDFSVDGGDLMLTDCTWCCMSCGC